mmetsp:Transcript_33489/g.59036  ORF Transcript_33489/g.59036 Transcript_33489/m.59036 type:complete len:522 (-) Transcript_33489:245-1810(-)
MDRLLPFIGKSEFAQDILASIESDGYVVLPGILTESEVEVEYSRMWQWVETVSPGVRRRSPKSWKMWPCSQRDMMQLHQAGWVFNELRELLAERVFEKLYGTRELHCSKDGFTLQRPTSQELNRSPNDHFDQGSSMYGLQCLQGSVALTDQEFEDGCFLCWPGSHKHHPEIVAARGRKAGRQDFVILNDREKDLLQSYGIEPRRVPVRRGDAILFRSDLAHCGASPIGCRQNFRAVVYICMLPAAMTPEDVYEKKQSAYQQLATGSHWPNQEEWFAQRGRGLDFTPSPYYKKPPQLTPRQRLLYGLDRYTPHSFLQPNSSSTKENKDVARTDVGANFAQFLAEASGIDIIASPARAGAQGTKGRRWGKLRSQEQEKEAAAEPACSGAEACDVRQCQQPKSARANATCNSEITAMAVGQEQEAEPAADTRGPSCSRAKAGEVLQCLQPKSARATATCNPEITAMAGDDAMDTFKEVRRLKKAVREIELLEEQLAKGKRLRQNQVQKVQKKDEYLKKLEEING